MTTCDDVIPHAGMLVRVIRKIYIFMPPLQAPGQLVINDISTHPTLSSDEILLLTSGLQQVCVMGKNSSFTHGSQVHIVTAIRADGMAGCFIFSRDFHSLLVHDMTQ